MSLIILKARAQQWAAVLRVHAEVVAVSLVVVTEAILSVYRGGAAL